MEDLLLAAAVVIVTHNSAAVVEECIKALCRMAPAVSAIVIDNASEDRTVERARACPGVQVIANAENRGFAAAVNQGVRSCDAEFLLLLNPDTYLRSGIDELVLASRQYGLAAGKLVDKTASAQRGFTIRRFPTAMTLVFEFCGLNRLWPSNPVNRKYRYLDRDLDQPGSVEQPAGAFLMFRRDVWERLGGMDEGFWPIWFEDVDFCRLAVSAGYRIEYVPTVSAEHQGGHSIFQISEESRNLYWCASLLRYAAKHCRSLGYRAICLAVVLSSAPRTVARMIRQRSLAPVRTCIRVVGLAGQCLLSPQQHMTRVKRSL